MTVTAAKFNVPFDALLDRTAALVPKVDVYSTVGGPFDWVKSSLALWVKMIIVSGGGGGGNASAGVGGGGGGASEVLIWEGPASMVPDGTLHVYVGAGGAAGLSGNNSSVTDESTWTLSANPGLGGAAGGAGGASQQLDGLTAGPGAGGAGGASTGTTGRRGINGAAAGSGNTNAAGGAGFGYGAGGGGGGNASDGGGGGGGGFEAYSSGTADDVLLATSAATGGVGAQGVVIITQWRGVAL